MNTEQLRTAEASRRWVGRLAVALRRRSVLFVIAVVLCLVGLVVFVVALGSVVAAAVAVVALALGLTVGVISAGAAVRERLDRAAASERMLRLARPPDSQHLRAALAAEIGDPTLRVLFRSNDTAALIDDGGAPVDSAQVADRRRFGLLGDDRGPAVYVELGPVDTCSPAKRASTLAAATLALEHTRLQALLQHQLTELRASRRRLVRAALEERRELEGRLHDGAQSTLFAAMAEMGRVRSRTTDEPVLQAVSESSRSLSRAVDELRRLVKGRIFPSALREAGLAAAIEVATEDSEVEVEVEPQEGDGRADEATEIAIYLTVIDLLAELHGDPGVDRIGVRLRLEDSVLSAEIAYPGAWPTAFPDAADDRVHALGGTMRRIDGFGVQIRIPCEQ